jgi:hypothetical protein
MIDDLSRLPIQELKNNEEQYSHFQVEESA